jgi:hypothetical protein
MSHQSIIIRPSLDEMTESQNILFLGEISFFVYAWTVDAARPLEGTATGCLFVHFESDDKGIVASTARCVRGGDPGSPLTCAVMLHTAPDGTPETWTNSDLVRQTLRISLPAVLPWLPVPAFFLVRGGRAVSPVTPPAE